jgi:hypothetical protein
MVSCPFRGCAVLLKSKSGGCGVLSQPGSPGADDLPARSS